jgi:hypothetical protein
MERSVKITAASKKLKNERYSLSGGKNCGNNLSSGRLYSYNLY